MKKGFTLMELLAVIVLLAIIATIAIPIFLKAISKSKETSFERRADLYVEAAEVAIATENLDGNFNPEECVVQENGNIKCDNDKVLEVEMKGDKPTYGTLTISGGKVINFIDLKFEDKYVTMGEKGKHTVSLEKHPAEITFTFDGVEYHALEGMTWEQFLESDYNTSNWTSGGSFVSISGIVGVGDSDNGDYALLSAVIKPNGIYYTYCCFDPGTQVLMSDGTTKNIEDIEVGEYVMSYNETTKNFEPKKVLRTITRHHSDDLVYINLSNGERIGMRAYHPLLTTEGYKSLRPELKAAYVNNEKLEKLKVGDTLVGYNSNVTITSIEERAPIENYDTYNLEIEDNHNYIVNGIVAHNAPVC